MNILYFTDVYHPYACGVVTSIDLYIQELQKLGHNVTIIGPHNQNYQAPNFHSIPSLPLPWYPEIRIAKLLNLTKRGFSYIPPKKWDIVHCHTHGPIGKLGLRFAKYHNIAHIATYHTQLSHYISKHYLPYLPFVKNIIDWLERRFYNQFNHLLLPSKSMEKVTQNIGITAPKSILPSGLDLAKFNNPPSFTHPQLPNRQKKTFRIGTVTRLAKEKNIPFLIKTFEELLKYRQDTQLCLYGDGPEKANLQKIIKQKKLTKNVTFTGNLKYQTVPSAWKSLDLCIYSCDSDTQALVLVEALASGLPLITLDLPVFQKYVDQQQNGFLLPPNPRKFAQKINLLLQDPPLRKKMSRVSIQKALPYDIKNLCQKLLTIYQTLSPKNHLLKKTSEK